jgi:hypothetical protein
LLFASHQNVIKFEKDARPRLAIATIPVATAATAAQKAQRT